MKTSRVTSELHTPKYTLIQTIEYYNRQIKLIDDAIESFTLNVEKFIWNYILDLILLKDNFIQERRFLLQSYKKLYGVK